MKLKWLRELKDGNFICMVWIPTEDNESDIWTKNVDGPTFDRHVICLVGRDQDMNAEN